MFEICTRSGQKLSEKFSSIFRIFKTGLNWFQIIRSGGSGKFCYLGGPGRRGLLDSLEIHGSVICNVSVFCIRTSKTERNIRFGPNFGGTIFIPPSDTGYQLF